MNSVRMQSAVPLSCSITSAGAALPAAILGDIDVVVAEQVPVLAVRLTPPTSGGTVADVLDSGGQTEVGLVDATSVLAWPTRTGRVGVVAQVIDGLVGCSRHNPVQVVPASVQGVGHVALRVGPVTDHQQTSVTVALDYDQRNPRCHV